MAVATNLGTGGSVLDAQYGSTVAPNTNEPLLLGHTGENYLYLSGVAGNFASTPDAAALDITGDIDIRVRVLPDDLAAVSNGDLFAKWSVAASVSWGLVRLTAGTLRLYWSADGTAVLSADSTAAYTFSGSPTWVRVTLDVDNGAAGRDIKFYTSPDGTTWTQLGATVTQAGTTSIFSGTSVIHIGSNGLVAPIAAKFYRAQVLNGIGGTTVFDADFTTSITSGAQTTFTESSANAATVTINRSTAGRKSCAVVRPVWLLGTDDFFEVADNALLDFGASDSFTVVAVVRDWGTSGTRSLVTKVSAPSPSFAGYALYQGSSSTYWEVEDAAVQSYTLRSYSAGGLLMQAGVRNTATDQVTLVDKTGSATVTDTTTASLSNAVAFQIGRFAGATPYYADAELLAVAVFRRALSASELAAIAAYYGAS